MSGDETRCILTNTAHETYEEEVIKKMWEVEKGTRAFSLRNKYICNVGSVNQISDETLPDCGEG